MSNTVCFTDSSFYLPDSPGGLSEVSRYTITPGTNIFFYTENEPLNCKALTPKPLPIDYHFTVDENLYIDTELYRYFSGLKVRYINTGHTEYIPSDSKYYQLEDAFSVEPELVTLEALTPFRNYHFSPTPPPLPTAGGSLEYWWDTVNQELYFVQPSGNTLLPAYTIEDTTEAERFSTSAVIQILNDTGTAYRNFPEHDITIVDVVKPLDLSASPYSWTLYPAEQELVLGSIPKQRRLTAEGSKCTETEFNNQAQSIRYVYEQATNAECIGEFGYVPCYKRTPLRCSS